MKPQHQIIPLLIGNNIPGPDGWTVEFYLDFFDIIRKYLLVVVEEVP
jgi:hypothetical protein